MLCQSTIRFAGLSTYVAEGLQRNCKSGHNVTHMSVVCMLVFSLVGWLVTVQGYDFNLSINCQVSNQLPCFTILTCRLVCERLGEYTGPHTPNVGKKTANCTLISWYMEFVENSSASGEGLPQQSGATTNLQLSLAYIVLHEFQMFKISSWNGRGCSQTKSPVDPSELLRFVFSLRLASIKWSLSLGAMDKH